MKENELNKKHIDINLIKQKLEKEMNKKNNFSTNQNYEMLLNDKIN